MGTVYAVRDDLFGDVVALKVLKGRERDTNDGIKREFRALAEVRHPNVVRLYELFADAIPGCFTMELLHGQELRRRALGENGVRTHLSPPALAGLFVQAAEGIHALHTAGILHRDVKPANLFVTDDDRVVVLDAGVAHLRRWGERTDDRSGTPGYLSPEMERGRVGPEGDWYAFGVALYEMLVGAKPTDSEAGIQVIPEQWSKLVHGLLEEEPERRLGGPALIAALHDIAGTQPSAYRTPPPLVFVGRERERALIREAVLAPGLRVVHVEGTSGIGKSTLVERAMDELGDDLIVLAARCRAEEHVPFKAIDPIADALTGYLSAEDARAVPDADLAALREVFPVLGRVPALRRGDPDPAMDPVGRRTACFRALRGLLRSLAERRRLVLWIDDLQWSDLDSATALAMVLQGRDAPELVLVVCSRVEDAATSAPLAAWRKLLERVPAQVVVRLGPLSSAEARALVNHLAGSATPDDGVLEQAYGHPFLIEDLGRRFERTMDRPMSRVDGLGETSTAILDLVALAAAPVHPAVLTHGRPGGVRTALRELEERGLVRIAVGPALRYEPYHDRVREQWAAALDDDRRRRGHTSLFEALVARGETEPGALVVHALGAGRAVEGRALAMRAASESVAALAFETAAGHYRSAATVERGADALEGLAEALRLAGRLVEAATAYLEAAALVPSGEAERLVQAAAEQYLKAGQVGQGLTTLRPVLARHGLTLPGSPLSATLVGMAFRFWFFARGVGKPGAVTRPDRSSVLWSVSTALAFIDPLAADAFGTRHLVEAARAGGTRLGRSLAFEATFEALFGGAFLAARAKGLVERADGMAAESGEPYDRAWARLSRCTVYGLVGEFRAAAAAGREAEKLFLESCRGVDWELGAVRTYLHGPLAWLGEVRELTARLPIGLDDARRRGDVFGATIHCVGQPSMGWLFLDRPEVVIDEGDALSQTWRAPEFRVLDYLHLLGATQALLYQGRAALALERLDRAWPALRRGGFLFYPYIHAELCFLRARVTTALGCADGARMRADARTIAGRGALRHGVAIATAIRAMAAGASGDRSAERRELAAADVAFVAAEMPILAAAARWRAAGGDSPSALRVLDGVAALGVVHPERLLISLLPTSPA
jgi:hypothetical protein